MQVDQYIIRDYRETDDAACKHLETRARQGRETTNPITKYLFKGSFSHPTTFCAKSKQFPAWRILVVEDTTKSYVCAVVCVTVKTVFWEGTERKVAYLFDLRVDENYQRNGLGQKLCERVQQWCTDQGAAQIYLSVNSDNKKALALYAKLGYTQMSVRGPFMQLLWRELSVDLPPEYEIKELSREEALAIWKKELYNRDMALVDPEPLFKSQYFLGSYLAVEKGKKIDTSSSLAGLLLWDGSSTSGFEVQQIILPVSVWKSTPMKYFLRLLGSLFIYWFFSFYSAILKVNYENLEYAWLGIHVLIISLFAYALTNAYRFFGAAPKFTTRARAFAPIARGPDSTKLLNALHAHVSNLSYNKGFGILAVNIDIEDKRFDRKSWFKTYFLQKSFGGEKLPPADPHAFHDPREI